MEDWFKKVSAHGIQGKLANQIQHLHSNRRQSVMVDGCFCDGMPMIDVSHEDQYWEICYIELV